MTNQPELKTDMPNCTYCGSNTRINTRVIKPKRAGQQELEVSQVKCKKMTCGMSGPIFKGEGSRARCGDHWRSHNTRTAPKAPTVKKIDWINFGQSINGHGALGQGYRINKLSDVGIIKFDLFEDRDDCSTEFIKTAYTLEEAKAAAQSHYGNLILTALEL